MKASIHPQFIETRFVCACGNTFTSSSNKPEVHVEVCYKCHPFYTGEHRFIDTKGRVENFQRAQKAAKERAQTVSTKKGKKERRDHGEPKTLRELLAEV